MSLGSRLASVPSIRKPAGSFRLVALTVGIGAVVGLIVAGVQSFVVFAQRATLGFAAERRIVLPDHASALRIAIALSCGAVLVTLIAQQTSRWRTREPLDAVEANALNGGTMTWYDAAAVVLPILASVSLGASVGIEAAVTQLGAVFASQLGRWLSKPRSDLRLLVGAGAAAAIAAAYRAPIAGMFYAFEIVLGSYSKRSLPAIGLASIAAVLATWLAAGLDKPFHLVLHASIIWTDYPLAVVIGIVAAFTGIAVMLLVTGIERLLKQAVADETLRRLVAALLLTLLSIRHPAVLGSGHAAIEHAVNGDIAGPRAMELLGAKAVASSASLGAGFRGGLFSAALLVGALLGQVVAWVLAVPGLNVHPGLCAMIGMASVAASVIGSPLAMIFLVLETTGDFDATVIVAMGALTASFLSDRLFGYSFATWRFQQRGLAIEGGHDVSRLQATPISTIIKPAKRSIAATADLDDVLRATSTAGPRGTAVYGLDGSFAGLVDPRLVEAVVAEDASLPVVAGDLVYHTTTTITPRTTLAEILDMFKADDRPTIAVVDPADSHTLVGCVRARDAYALASAVLDAQRREDLGVGGLS